MALSVRKTRHKVSLLGLGTMGLRHARVFSSLPERFELVGGYDLRRDAGAAAHEAGLARLSGEAEAIAACDVLVLATPIRAHAATVARALAAGKHLLVEKPLCSTAAEADALVGAAAGGRARLFTGHSERFNPVVRALARLVRAEPVVALGFQRVGPSRPSDCGVLVNLGVHDLDLASYLGGGAVVLRGAVGDDDLADVLVETSGGAVGHLHVDRTSARRRRSVTLTTPQWTYEGDLLAHRLVRTARDTGTSAEVPLPLEEPLVAQARALADALDGSAPRELATGVDGAVAVRLADLASSMCSSATSGRSRGRRA
jgi:UDP-N-acetylglucosamine 3-dehydrogenase